MEFDKETVPQESIPLQNLKGRAGSNSGLNSRISMDDETLPFNKGCQMSSKKLKVTVGLVVIFVIALAVIGSIFGLRKTVEISGCAKYNGDQCESCLDEYYLLKNGSCANVPTKMKVKISGEAAKTNQNGKSQAGYGGTYIIAKEEVNGKPHWLHQSGYRAFWWDKKFSKWKIGKAERLGTSIAAIIGPDNIDSTPVNIQGWRYWNADDDEWKTAPTGDILIRDVSRVEVPPPPKKLTITLNGVPSQKHGSRAGTYTLAQEEVNNYPAWVQTNGENAIWFSKVGSSWIVGEKSDLGSDTGGWISGPLGVDDNPHMISSGWRFWQAGAYKQANPGDIIFGVQ